MANEESVIPRFTYSNFNFLSTIAFIIFELLWDMPERRRAAVQRDPRRPNIFRDCDYLEHRLLQMREALPDDDEEALREIDHLLKLTRDVRFEEERRTRFEAMIILWVTHAMQRLF
ncbi:hypothetical protein F5884DRAFT_753477 [Xylogone sp. PMI_703]|nr:hypothetical protein F5884DRAFT_753477 [Xylogone sp. PMI_703]